MLLCDRKQILNEVQRIRKLADGLVECVNPVSELSKIACWEVSLPAYGCHVAIFSSHNHISQDITKTVNVGGPMGFGF